MKKLFIATPAFGETFYTSYVESVFNLTCRLKDRGWAPSFNSVTFSNIADSRNLLLSYWYDQSDAEYLLFLDADMGFDPNLIFQMIEFNKPVVGVVYPKRSLDLTRLAEPATLEGTIQAKIANAYDYVVKGPKFDSSTREFIQVEACGTGILLLHRDCISMMINKIPTIIDPTPDVVTFKAFKRLLRPFDFVTVSGRHLSEDFSFCHRWRSGCGGEIWANITHEIVHVGLQRHKARYADALPQRSMKLPIKRVTRVRMVTGTDKK
jgi:hypothetical protein